MSTVPLCLHHSLEHVHALRSHERGCFRVVQTLWAEKIQSTTDAGSLNTFGRNEIEVAAISSALLRIACLVILYKTCHIPDQELAAEGYQDRYEARPFRRRHWLVAKRRTAVVFRFRFCCIRRGCAKHCGGFPYGRSRFWPDAAHLHARRYGRWFELII